MVNKILNLFIGYKDSKKIRTLCISCPQMGIYKINFDENIYFLKVFLLNTWNFRKKLAISSKTNIIVILCIVQYT